jgi:cell division protein FtsL
VKARDAVNLLPVFLVMLSFFMAWALFHIWTRHMATELGYAITVEQTKQDNLLSENKSLRLEISTLKSSRRLEEIAKSKLGMNSPSPEQVVYLWLGE